VPGLRDSIVASGGVLTACSPRALGEVVVKDRPFLLDGALRVSPGGVLPWEDIAAAILATAGANAM